MNLSMSGARTLLPKLLFVCFSLLTGFAYSQGLVIQPEHPQITPIFEVEYRGFSRVAKDSLLSNPLPRNLTREFSLDSTQTIVVIEEKLFNRLYRMPVAMDLDTYVRLRLQHDLRKLWRQSLRRLRERLATDAGGGGIELNIPVKIKSKTFRRIFGGDRVGLRVSGNISFELAGRSESREGSPTNAIDQRGTFSPKFKQTQQFRVEGRVGDRVTVSVDQNSEATFDFENTLKLTYDGDEDDIVQRIEAGNVALQLPATNYVSTNSNHQGLFGLKTEMQVGKFKFTGIASLERGENESLSITGSVREQTTRIKDIDYVNNRFFFVDTLYQQSFENQLNTNQMILQIDPGTFITQLDVWKTVPSNQNRDETFPGLATINPKQADQNTELQAGRAEKGNFKRLEEGKDYDFDYQRGYFWLNGTVQNNEILAVAYATAAGDTVGTLYQNIDTTGVGQSEYAVFLRLIKPNGVNQPDYPVWKLTMRNVYNLGGLGIKSEGFDAKILFTRDGSDVEVDPEKGKTYNYLTGIDRLNEQGAVVAGGDKKVDVRQRFIFDLANGYLIFPSLTPFNPQNLFKDEWPDDRRVDIYNTTNTTEISNQSKFEIEVTTTATSNTFDLGFNVLEGSERVRLNGRELTRGVDYTIDYFSGQLEITAPEARRADAQVDIEYEKGALFQLDKKTLLGGRLEYELGNNNFIALTGLYHSRSTLDQRIRLGQEPFKNFIWDINTALDFKPNFLTKLFDKLPIVETSAESKLRIEAEMAQVNPNPNTFNEKELGDNDGVAYIDDFEGSRRFTSLGIQYRIWSPASVPMRFRLLSNEAIDYEVPPSASALVKKNYILSMDSNRLRFNWYNPFQQIPTQSIFPDRDVTAQSGTTTNVLNLRWRNDDVPVDSAWVGIMRSTIAFVDQQKTKFIELWVRGNKGQVNIDLGRISEDYYVRGVFPDYNNPNIPVESYNNLNTEDRNFNGLLDLEDGEDTGIDGVANNNTNPLFMDAGDDDWIAPRDTRPLFLGINGTEGNSQQQGARFPDTEDLDGDGDVNLFNDYIEYSFRLDNPDDPYFAGQTVFDDGTPTGWKLYRIPIRDKNRKLYGNPDTTFQQVFYVRLWMNDLPPTGGQYDSLQIAAFDFVGNEWEEVGWSAKPDDPVSPIENKFGITVYNTDEHSGPPINYTSPPGVTGIRDRITQAVSKEQSLAMRFIDFRPGAKAEARRLYSRQKLNLINYDRLKMFVHGDTRLKADGSDNVVFYIRMGASDQVYYEYRLKVRPGWELNDLVIDFEELSHTKSREYRVEKPDAEQFPFNRHPLPFSPTQETYNRPDPNNPYGEFVALGNPSLHNINYIVIGAMNLGDSDLSDVEIWLDEMRVTGVERASGTAMRLKTELQVADIGRLAASWEMKDDNFRRLDQQFADANGKEKNVQKQLYTASMRLDKFMPESWGFEIPISAKLNRDKNIPKYFYNSDEPTNYAPDNFGDRIKTFFGFGEVDPALDEHITQSESRSIGTTISRRGGKRDPWYLFYTLNQLRLDVDYSKSESSSPIDEFNRRTSLSSQLNFSIPFGKNNFIRPFGFLGNSKLAKLLSGQKFYYTPSSVSSAITLSDNTDQRKSRLESTAQDPNVNVKTTRNFTADWRLTDAINIRLRRDYQSDPQLVESDSVSVDNGQLVKSFDSDRDVRAGDVISNIFNRLDFGTDTRLTQSVNANYSPKLFDWLNPNYTYSSNFTYSLDRPQTNARGITQNVSHNVTLDFRMASLMEDIYNPNKPRPRRPSGKSGDNKSDDDEGSGFSVPNPALMLWHVFHSFKSFTLSLKENNSLALGNVDGVPDWRFQFGLNRDPNVGRDSTFQKIITPPVTKYDRSVDGTVTMDITRNISANLKYLDQKTISESNSQQTVTKNNTLFFTGDDPGNESKGWWKFIPDWRLSFRGAEKLPLLNKVAKSATIEHNRSGKLSESVRNRQTDALTYTINYQPLLGITVNTIWGVQTTIRANTSKTFDYRTAGAITKREQSGFNINLSYSVSRGFKIPLPFLKKSLKNEIQFSLAYDRSSNRSFSRQRTEKVFQELEDSKNWKLRPAITYRFSAKVNGTAFYEQSANETKITGKTSYKEFGINVNIAIR
jgi:hypothetical protein